MLLMENEEEVMTKQAKSGRVIVAKPKEGDALRFVERSVSTMRDILDNVKGRQVAEEKNTNVPCVIPLCTGTILEESSKRYLGDPMARIIGPGGRNQMTLFVVLHCSRCGIIYHHLPRAPN